jgi:hypothetical protein
MSDTAKNVIHTMREEVTRTLMSIRKPEYASDMKIVHPYAMRPEEVKAYPAGWLEISRSTFLRGERAGARRARTLLFRLSVVTREDIKAPVEEATAAITSDLEAALDREESRIHDALKERTGASLVCIEPPTWVAVETTRFRPFGSAVGVFEAKVVYDRGRP